MNQPKKSVEVQVLSAQNRSKPIPFTLHSTELFGLLVESVQLAKLIATEKRDLEAIRADYALRSQFLENLHKETLTFLENEYKERSQIIAAINENGKLLIVAGEYNAAQQIMNRLTDFIANNSPLKTALELRNSKLH
jgi:hypothetical protein